ncbi:MAG: hypothetical protein OHK006_25640 [Thermodesulfovibrionales bacterium]
MQEVRTDNRARRLRLAAAVVLFAGLAASALIYLTAADDPGDAIGCVIVDGGAVRSGRRSRSFTAATSNSTKGR